MPRQIVCPSPQMGGVTVPSNRHTPDPRGSSMNPSGRAKRRRVAARREGLAARILVCERERDGPLQKLLRRLHFTIEVCDSLEEALDATARKPFQVAVLDIDPQLEGAIGMLQLLRRAMPHAPIVLVLEDPTPAARLATLTVRPFYVAVPPVSQDEMASVLRDALAAARKPH